MAKDWQNLAEVAKNYQMLPKVAIVGKIGNKWQKLSNIGKSCQKCRKLPKMQKLPKVVKSCQKLSEVVKFGKIGKSWKFEGNLKVSVHPLIHNYHHDEDNGGDCDDDSHNHHLHYEVPLSHEGLSDNTWPCQQHIR